VTEAWSRFDIYQFDWQFLLRTYGIQHWGFDYGQGMVAHASDETRSGSPAYPVLDVPIRVREGGTYSLWVRYLRHPHAGELLLSLDGQSLASVVGNDPITGFVWQDVGQVELDPGEHIVGLQNRDGLCAVNTLALVQEDTVRSLQARSEELAASVPNIYLLEAETDFDIRQAEAARETPALSAGRAVVLNAGLSISTTVDLVIAGAYRVGVHASIPDPATPLTVTLGDEQRVFVPGTASGDLLWLTAEPVQLAQGSLQIRLEAAGSAVVDTLALYTNSPADSPDALFETWDTSAEVVYERLDPTRYRARVQSDGPVLLSLAETYDPLWSASGSDFKVTSLPLFGVVNGFPLERAGTYELLIEYEPQQWARLGRVLTILAVMAAGPFLLFVHQRGRSRSEDPPG
jgi:hypothetical protein